MGLEGGFGCPLHTGAPARALLELRFLTGLLYLAMGLKHGRAGVGHRETWVECARNGAVVFILPFS